MLNYVNRIRALVYVLGVLVIGITSCNVLDAEMYDHFSKKRDRRNDRNDFYPPDLIPHPHLPQPPPPKNDC